MSYRYTTRRKAVITFILLGVLTALVVGVPLSIVQAQQVAQVVQVGAPPQGDPGTIITLTFQLTNNINDATAASPTTTFNITASNVPAGVTASSPGPVQVANNVAGGTTVNFTVQLSLGGNVVPGTYNNLLVTVSGSYNSTSGVRTVSASTFGVFIVTVGGQTATPTLSPTVTPTPTRTPGPTPTPGPTCPEGARDPGNDLGSAKLVLVDSPVTHGICEIGDEDWFRFGAVGGKVYTIDIERMDAGLDLSLELYDANGQRLAFNDDFFNRDPARPDPKDIRPRIQSWHAPRDGLYFVRVRDTLSIGGGNRTYVFVVRSESYGPTPALVGEICRDLYEDDGLPEQAKLILPNEIQPGRRLCPTGDADWVKFFGKAGKIYYIYTDTRPYRNTPDFNNQTQAGADTVMYLFDRDGTRLLDFNDDIPGSLDSQIRFVPSVDGFYYVQIKNNGDLGNQFIRYDLVLQLCVPDEECGRAPQPAVLPTPAAPTPTVAPFDDRTPTPTPGGTPPPGGAVGDEFGSAHEGAARAFVNGPLVGFADAAFDQLWQRTDRVVASGRVQRSWMWGPRGLMARAESYQQAISGMRQVQYFDKGRMELNNPFGDRSSPWFVTSGLLVMELVTGRMQVGDNEFVQREAAAIPIAGDTDDPNAPSYASFAIVITRAEPDQTGQLPRMTIDRQGRVGTYDGPVRAETRIAHYVPESGHNIPAVFWDYLTARGLIYDQGRVRTDRLFDWLFTLGYPISEPFWARVRLGGVERDVLIQLFERRTLTYVPDNPPGWRVEMGNVGRHYYRWRYGEDLP
ncbi:hypothetical protein [Roseiflexus sp.]|uniref:COG1470 family protein n=1 Tax=Roseiflexus sp. TaxID=2562120 RepID=UPI00398AB5A2